jgi:RecB family exonuclease|tara:strand:- start:227 stop:1111 length:885 start_codon:yes stop_codon:yes gene_type:complete
MARKKSISYSQFSQWDVCPWMWKLNYVDKLGTFTDNIHTLFGTSMHEVLQEYLKVMYSDSIKAADELLLNEELEDRLKKNFMEITQKNGGEEFCTKDQMVEFYEDGLKILEFFKKKRNQYFSKRGYELIGIETALNYDLPKNIKFRGYIDLIIKDTVRNRIKIIDIKTSTHGWNKYQKADKNKTDQLLLYKKFYSQQHDVPMDRIEVEYFIVKRKLWENTDFPQKRIQTFIPANGTPSINKVNRRLDAFMEDCFTDDGEYRDDHTYSKLPSKKNCRWCEFKDKPELCDKNGAKV